MNQFYEHDGNGTYLGSEEKFNQKFDYWFEPQNGFPTVIARYGVLGDYISGLLFVKQELNALQNNDNIKEKLNYLINQKDETISLLSKATLLSIEQNLLDENLKSIYTPKKMKM